MAIWVSFGWPFVFLGTIINRFGNTGDWKIAMQLDFNSSTNLLIAFRLFIALYTSQFVVIG